MRPSLFFIMMLLCLAGFIRCSESKTDPLDAMVDQTNNPPDKLAIDQSIKDKTSVDKQIKDQLEKDMAEDVLAKDQTQDTLLVQDAAPSKYCMNWDEWTCSESKQGFGKAECLSEKPNKIFYNMTCDLKSNKCYCNLLSGPSYPCGTISGSKAKTVCDLNAYAFAKGCCRPTKK